MLTFELRDIKSACHMNYRVIYHMTNNDIWNFSLTKLSMHCCHAVAYTSFIGTVVTSSECH